MASPAHTSKKNDPVRMVLILYFIGFDYGFSYFPSISNRIENEDAIFDAISLAKSAFLPSKCLSTVPSNNVNHRTKSSFCIGNGRCCRKGRPYSLLQPNEVLFQSKF